MFLRKTYTYLLVAFAVLFFLIPTTFAQENSSIIDFSSATSLEEPGTTEVVQVEVEPVITSRSEIQIGKKIIFDASKSKVPEDENVSYVWQFSDGTRDEGIEVVHIFNDHGQHNVTLEITTQRGIFKTTKEIFSYKQAVTFFYNGAADTFNSNIESVMELAQDNGIFLNVIASTEQVPLLSEDAIVKELSKKISVLESSQVIVGGPSGTNFLSALAKLPTTDIEDESGEKVSFNDHVVIVSTEENLWIFERIALRLLKLIDPNQLLLVKKDPFSVLNFLLQSENIDVFAKKLSQQDYTLLSGESAQDSPIAILSYLVGRAVANGVPGQVITFILLIPIILTVIAFIRQIVGVEIVGIFQTIVLTLSFFILGPKFGTFIFFFVIAIGILMRYIMHRAHLLYVSKVTLTLSAASIGILLLIVFASDIDIFFGLDTTSSHRALLSIFPMLLIAVQADKLSALLIKQGKRHKELIALLATFFSVLLSYIIIQWDTLATLLFAIPELIAIAFIIQYIFGRYTGLRVVEYIRFQELFRHDVEE